MARTKKPRHPAIQQDGHGFWRFLLKLEDYQTALAINHPIARPRDLLVVF